MMKQDPMLVAALRMLADRRCPIPVRPDKVPRVRWAEYAHRIPSKDRVKHWWRTWPGSGIALVCESSRLCVIDFDNRPGLDIEANIGRFKIKYPVATHTLWAQTGGGGRHVFFNLPKGVEVKVKTWGPGIDVRATGTICVVPPTISDRGQYVWINDCPIQDIPQDLLQDLLDAQPRKVMGSIAPVPDSPSGGPIVPAPVPGQGQGQAGQVRRITAPIYEGTRNNMMASLAGRVRRQGCSEEQIIHVLRARDKSCIG